EADQGEAEHDERDANGHDDFSFRRPTRDRSEWMILDRTGPCGARQGGAALAYFFSFFGFLPHFDSSVSVAIHAVSSLRSLSASSRCSAITFRRSPGSRTTSNNSAGEFPVTTSFMSPF